MAEESTPLERLQAMSTGLTIQKNTKLADVTKAILEKASRGDDRPKINPEDLIEESGVQCKIPGCEGVIVRKFCIPYIPAQFGGENMMGPGSENIATIKNKKLQSIYCNCCMVKYEEVPQ